jgi:hypothetical protein
MKLFKKAWERGKQIKLRDQPVKKRNSEMDRVKRADGQTRQGGADV